MGEEQKATDTRSIKLFFLVLAAIVVYQAVDYFRGEPDWETFRFAPGAFSVDMAGEPTLRTLETDLACGMVELQYFMFRRGSVNYALAYGDLPEPCRGEAVLAQARDDMLQKVQGEVLAAEDAVLGGHAGRRFLLSAADGSRLEVRLCRTGGRLYQLMAGGPSAEMEGDPQISRFFSSFQVRADSAGGGL